jgi:FkbM family methyltransferase
MTGTFRNAWTLVTHPRMAAKYAQWLGTALTGRDCIAGLLGGGSIAGFQRFTDYYALNLPSQAEYQLLRRVVRPGEVVADVGANVGAFTVTMGLLGKSDGNEPARVYAFEPSPTTVQALRANVERNRLGNVEVIQAAVSDRPGQLRLTNDPVCSARSRLTAAPTGNGDGFVVGVEAISLDQFCNRIPKARKRRSCEGPRVCSEKNGSVAR